MKTENYRSTYECSMEQNIKAKLQQEFPLPEQVEQAKQAAFQKIRNEQQPVNQLPKTAGRTKKTAASFKRLTAAAAVLVLCSTLCITHPALAEKIPVIGHVFEILGSSFGFSGDFEEYAVPFTESGSGLESEQTPEYSYSMTQNGMTVTLSEIYCNSSALYLSMVLETKDAFPATRSIPDSDNIELLILDCGFTFLNLDLNDTVQMKLDGRMIDDHTYAGVLRYDLPESIQLADQETLAIDLTFPTISGAKQDGQNPEMPSELWNTYEEAMAAHGLGTSEEAYSAFTEEEKAIELQLFQEMQNAYAERYPQTRSWLNPYLKWWTEGPWTFHLEVQMDDSQTIVKQISEDSTQTVGLKTVTRTPFEIIIEPLDAVEKYIVVLDANGDPLSSGNTGGSDTILAIQDHDVSKIHIFICDYYEYMDEIKDTLRKEYEMQNKSYQQLLEERALYHREIVF